LRLAARAAAAAAIALAGCGGSTTRTVTTTDTVYAGAGTGTVPASGAAGDRAVAYGTTHKIAGALAHPGSTVQSGTSGGTGRGASGGALASASSLTRHVVDDTEKVQITGHQGQLIIQRGVVIGTPIGSGTVIMRDRLTGDSVNVAFTVAGGGGSVNGLGVASLQVKGASVIYHGTAHLTGGTGIYSRVQAPHLTVTGSGTLSGQTTLHVIGVEWY
jgi:hypothetical protein